ncbi:hypothetical protein LLB_2218 [Legionella longbeachae D-4968]|nr:hypothetical protein LLB_2218 [Legionella longbeachae D-4968]
MPTHSYPFKTIIQILVPNPELGFMQLKLIQRCCILNLGI